MEEDHSAPAFIVYKSTIAGFVPVASFYYCIHCQQDLSHWVMKQSLDESSVCPHCEVPIEAQQVGKAQRETKIGCLLSIVSFFSLLLVPAAIIAVLWLMYAPR